MTLYVLTHTNKIVDIENLRPGDITPTGIAIALESMRRFQGRGVSVLRHTFRVYELICKQYPNNHNLQLLALLHDAPEAFIGDIPAPILDAVVDLQRLHNKVSSKIYNHFGARFVDFGEVMTADKVSLMYEYSRLVGDPKKAEPVWGFGEVDPDHFDVLQNMAETTIATVDRYIDEVNKLVRALP